MTEMISRRKLPKLAICMTKSSLENMRNKALFNTKVLDFRGIRRRKLPLYQCTILELREMGFKESADYLQDLMYDNVSLLEEDDIGVVVDMRERDDYVEEISEALQTAEKEKERNNTKDECLVLLELATKFAERGRGIYWLAEKFFLAAIAVASQFLIDGGRLKACCKYLFASFLLDKFPKIDVEEPNEILSDVRDRSSGKKWIFYELHSITVPKETVFVTSALQLHRVLLDKARKVRQLDPAKAERLARLAQRRAEDAKDPSKSAEAIIEMGIAQLMMKNLNNALNTFEKALGINNELGDVKGICDAKMHLSSVILRLGNYEKAAALLTEMGELALQHGYRRHLGRALHLLGELHLRRQKPELGTKHLAEAFHCFIGGSITPDSRIMVCQKSKNEEIEYSGLTDVYIENIRDTFVEEAEQSRLMEAVSAGQEIMAGYFNMVNKAKKCAIARHKIILWKMNKEAWWVSSPQEELIPCQCSEHSRTAVDVARTREARKKAQMETWLRSDKNESYLDIQKDKPSQGYYASFTPGVDYYI